MTSQRRSYKPFWEKLKREKRLTVLLNSSYVYRFRRMLAKEKNLDIAYKLEQSIAYKKSIIHFDVSPAPDKPGKSKVKVTMAEKDLWYLKPLTDLPIK